MIFRLPSALGRSSAAALAATVCGAALLLNQAAAVAAPPPPAPVFVYDGAGAIDQGFVKFGAAAARTVVKSATLPDLDGYACVVLPIPQTTFTSAETNAFSSYVTGGGTLIALGENSAFPSANTNINRLSATLGAGMTIVTNALNGPSSNIDSTSFTVGVATIKYLAASTVTVSSPGFSLVHTAGTGTQPTLLGAAVLGQGVFVVSGDSNAFSDLGNAYAAADNGKLVANLCGIRTTSTTIACPGATTGVSNNCTVTVTDTTVAGHKTSPVGTAIITTTGTGTLGNGGTCPLVPTANPGESTCTVPFTPSAGTAQLIVASYDGDVRHSGSGGRVDAAVAPAPSPSPTATVAPALPRAGTPGSNGSSSVAFLLVLLAAAIPLAGRSMVRRVRRG